MEIKQGSFDVAKGTAGFLFRPLLISAMVTCIAAAWVWVLESAVGSWRGEYLIWTVGVVTLEVLLVERQFRRRRAALQEPRTWQTRLAETGMMLLVIKAAGYFTSGLDALARDAARWVVDPASFFDFNFIVGIIVVGTLWLLASSLAGNLAEIEDETNLPGEPEAARARLQEDFVLGAIFLLIAVGAQRLSISRAGLGLRPVQLGGLTVLPVVYVGLGILLFAQVRLSLLLARWKREALPVTSGIERRWTGWSAVFVAGVAALAFLLPAGETSLGVYLLTYMALAFAFLGQLVGFLLFLLISLILMPFGFLHTQTPLPPRLPQLPDFPPAEQPGPAPEWLSSIQTILMIVFVVIVVVFVVSTYWRDRRASGIWKTIGEMLAKAWGTLVTWLRGSTQRVLQLKRHAPAAGDLGGARRSLAWWRGWRARSARDRVRRLYLALLERAARAGHVRRPAQTPFEYSHDLQSHVHETEGLAALTEAFVEARYGRQDFTPAQVSRLHRLWQRLRDELRRL